MYVCARMSVWLYFCRQCLQENHLLFTSAVFCERLCLSVHAAQPQKIPERQLQVFLTLVTYLYIIKCLIKTSNVPTLTAALAGI